MKTLPIAALLIALAAPVLAQTKAADPAASLTEGEVRKVDAAAKKLTVQHGEIKNLEMPAMTMVFQVKDGVMIDKLKAGDKIRFVAEKAATGLVITRLQRAP